MVNFLYLTGSSDFIKALKDHAKTIGRKLNEFRLQAISDSKVSRHVNSEELLFMFLGLQYIKPEDRIDKSSLKLLNHEN